MTALNAIYISPRDQLLRDILVAVRGMSMPELAALADEAQRIKRQREELSEVTTMQVKQLAKPIILEPWALDAMRELVDIVSHLNDGMFVSPQDLGDRLLRCAEGIALTSGDPHVEES